MAYTAPKMISTIVYQDVTGKSHFTQFAAEQANALIALEEVLDCVGRGGEWDHEMIIRCLIDKKAQLAEIFKYL